MTERRDNREQELEAAINALETERTCLKDRIVKIDKAWHAVRLAKRAQAPRDH